MEVAGFQPAFFNSPPTLLQCLAAQIHGAPLIGQNLFFPKPDQAIVQMSPPISCLPSSSYKKLLVEVCKQEGQVGLSKLNLIT